MIKDDFLETAKEKSKRSRKKIFSNLSASVTSSGKNLESPKIKLSKPISDEEKLKMFIKNLEENKASVLHATSSSNIKGLVEKIVEDQKIKNCFIGRTLAPLLKDISTVKLDENYFARKEIYNLEASVTYASGGIADVGAVAVVPSSEEPRSVTLIPPIHIVVVDEKKLFNTIDDFLSELMPSTSHLPTNIVFVSGPSKTADLVGKLCFGIHGPKQLYVIINHG